MNAQFVDGSNWGSIRATGEFEAGILGVNPIEDILPDTLCGQVVRIIGWLPDVRYAAQTVWMIISIVVS